jgi:hypothetical protein
LRLAPIGIQDFCRGLLGVHLLLMRTMCRPLLLKWNRISQKMAEKLRLQSNFHGEMIDSSDLSLI